ncbi:MAG: hypothetical protein GC155_01515 [Alphaproteobacteria bacterium]|nr:hypothetical protein [Alphaproteobacteria bacterium]
MMRFALLVLLSLSGAVAAPALAQTVPALFAKAITPPPSTQLYAFDFVDENDGDKPSYIAGHIDPSKPKGERATITVVRGEETDLKKIKARYERNSSGEDIWCDKLSSGADGPISDRGETAGGRIFGFRPLPPKPDSDQRDLYKQLWAEMLVDAETAQIRSFSARLLKPWKPIIIAKVYEVNMTGQCAPAPNGRTYTSRLDTAFRASALGIDIHANIIHTISNLTPVAQAKEP